MGLLILDLAYQSGGAFIALALLALSMGWEQL
jgi:hypothetical protein